MVHQDSSLRVQQFQKDHPQLPSEIRELIFLRILGLQPEGTEKSLGQVKEMMKEPQDCSEAIPCFQSGCAVCDHTCGTFHGGVVDYPSFFVSEMHLGRFPDSMEFQSWNVNFKLYTHSAVERTFCLRCTAHIRTVTCVRTRMAHERMKKVCCMRTSCLSISHSPLMSHPSSLLFPDNVFDTAFQSLTFTDLLLG